MTLAARALHVLGLPAVPVVDSKSFTRVCKPRPPRAMRGAATCWGCCWAQPQSVLSIDWTVSRVMGLCAEPPLPLTEAAEAAAVPAGRGGEAAFAKAAAEAAAALPGSGALGSACCKPPAPDVLGRIGADLAAATCVADGDAAAAVAACADLAACGDSACRLAGAASSAGLKASDTFSAALASAGDTAGRGNVTEDVTGAEEEGPAAGAGVSAVLSGSLSG